MPIEEPKPKEPFSLQGLYDAIQRELKSGETDPKKVPHPPELSWFSIDFLARVLINAEALLNEAKILLEAGAHRRAAFLAITSYEETQKLVILSKGAKEKQSGFHELKFQDWNELTPWIAKNIVEKMGGEQMIPKWIERGIVDPETHKRLVEFMSALTAPDLAKAFNLTELRKALIFEDTETKITILFTSNKGGSDSFASFMIRFVEPRLATFLTLLKYIPEEKLKQIRV